MASTDNFTSTLLPLIDKIAAEADFSKVLFEKTFLNTDFNKANTIVTGVRHGNVVPIISDVPNYESFPFVDANACDITECDLNTNYSGKKWELGLIECRIPICLRSFQDDFLVFWNQYKMVNPTTDVVTQDYLETALMQFLADKVKTSLNAAKWRTAYFGDKASSSGYFNGFNGFFTQAEANAANVVVIAKNDGVTYADQQMTGQEIYDTLVAMDEKRSAQVWSSDNEVVYMNQMLAQRFASYLNGLTETSCCPNMEINPEAIGSRRFTTANLMFRGVPIVPVHEFDGIINGTAELNGGGGAAARVDPNRILWTHKSNLLVGTSQQEDLDMFEIWYDRTDKKVYMEAGAYLGATIPLNEYVLAI